MAITNQNKISTGETWATITTTWATETRTWLAISQLISNTPFVRTTRALWSSLSTPWLETTPWLMSGGMINMVHNYDGYWDDSRFLWDDSIAWDKGGANITNVSKPS